MTKLLSIRQLANIIIYNFSYNAKEHFVILQQKNNRDT